MRTERAAAVPQQTIPRTSQVSRTENRQFRPHWRKSRNGCRRSDEDEHRCDQYQSTGLSPNHGPLPLLLTGFSPSSQPRRFQAEQALNRELQLQRDMVRKTSRLASPPPPPLPHFALNVAQEQELVDVREGGKWWKSVRT